LHFFIKHFISALERLG